MTVEHAPVLLEEVLQGLSLRSGAVVLDATVGLGGHAEALLEAVGTRVGLIGVDRDAQALELAQRRLQRFGERVRLVHGNFETLGRILRELGVGELDAALFDLGVSSLQLGEPERGFSFARPGPLDMRMDRSEPLTAEELVNRAPERELAGILREYGEERFSRRIARAIVRRRPLLTTEALAQVVRGAVPAGARGGRIDPATRTFQAIRIAVNRELEALPLGLEQAIGHLKGGGRVAVLSYHSLEDRIVKRTFREGARGHRLRVVTPKPVRPSPREVASNPRARSARLRIAEKAALA